jgi:hypothetical protein
MSKAIDHVELSIGVMIGCGSVFLLSFPSTAGKEENADDNLPPQ